ncbi:hypothetical protein KUTeg_018097 [Tegillarca granosa]|uniref:Uncharacterized protein n=1 Tax=Tegillarca granosa TaxID=220873 RepID=A0ABQ9EIB5_TEGGR|nr:hypothetical protein KUTeg_018097 [Tegillarca granosa]
MKNELWQCSLIKSCSSILNFCRAVILLGQNYVINLSSCQFSLRREKMHRKLCFIFEIIFAFGFRIKIELVDSELTWLNQSEKIFFIDILCSSCAVHKKCISKFMATCSLSTGYWYQAIMVSVSTVITFNLYFSNYRIRNVIMLIRECQVKSIPGYTCTPDLLVRAIITDVEDYTYCHIRKTFHICHINKRDGTELNFYTANGIFLLETKLFLKKKHISQNSIFPVSLISIGYTWEGTDEWGMT